MYRKSPFISYSCISDLGHACLKLNLVLISHLTGKCAMQLTILWKNSLRTWWHNMVILRSQTKNDDLGLIVSLQSQTSEVWEKPLLFAMKRFIWRAILFWWELNAETSWGLYIPLSLMDMSVLIAWTRFLLHTEYVYMTIVDDEKFILEVFFIFCRTLFWFRR